MSCYAKCRLWFFELANEGVGKNLPVLAVLENLPHSYFERSGWVSGVGKGLADFRLPVPKEIRGENGQFSQRQMQYQRL